MEQGTPEEKAEALYIAVFERVTAKANYLQPPGYRQLLPEADIAAAVGAVFSGIIAGLSSGFLARFGEKAADL
jgi:hypothetical protein